MQRDTGTTRMEADGEPKGAAKLGGELRTVREGLGWSLAEVAAGLRIRLPYLEAIERGELSALPGAAYQTGFLRTYSQALGLDPEEILRRFRAEGMGVAPKAELSFLSPVPDRAVPTGAIVMVGVVLVLGGYGLWFRHTEHERRLAASVPAVPAELAPLAVPKAMTPPPAPAVVAAKQAAVPTASASTSTAAAPPAATAATTPAPPAAPAAGSAPIVPAQGQVILATGDSWIEVKDPTGTILFSRVLHAGQSWPVPDEAGLTMTAGNAGATELAANGKAGAPLGADGAVLRNYALTPAPATAPKPD